jgi:hypothetical protein
VIVLESVAVVLLESDCVWSVEVVVVVLVSLAVVVVV